MDVWILQYDPFAFPCFPPSHVFAVNLDSAPCSELLTMLPYYMNHIVLPKQPAYIIFWVGGPDAEQGVPLDSFTSCVNQFIPTATSMVQGAGLNTVLVWPSINIDTYQAANGDPDYLALVDSYNQALPAILAQYPNVVPVDVTTLTTGSDGWGNPNDQYIDFYPAGWQTVLPNFRAVIQ